MGKTETIEDFYKNKYNWIPEQLKQEIGHFNVFNLKPYVGTSPQSVPYKRRDYYKVMLVRGTSLVYYADKTVTVKKQALCFSNPLIPYKWDNLEGVEGGIFCIFNDHFFNQYGKLSQYSVFQPNGRHIFELDDEQAYKIEQVYKKMFEEIQSDYIHKYDVLRNLFFELLHFVLKLESGVSIENFPINASQRIATIFLELLERQFPVDEHHQKIQLRSASEFAQQLNIHVNHLNRAIKETTQKTTTEIIAERLVQESKTLLKHSTWNISEIAHALGFLETTHFNNFFKKHIQISPLKFRKGG